MKVYIDPYEKNVDIDFSRWFFPFDEKKTFFENTVEMAKCVADELLTLDMHVCTDRAELGDICISSAASDDARFYFSLKDAMEGAAHAIATNYGSHFREKNMEETKRHIAALRDAVKSAVDVLDAAAENPRLFYDENRK